MIQIEKATYGIGQDNDVDITDFLLTNHYHISKTLNLTTQFGDPYVNIQKHIYVKVRKDEPNKQIMFVEDCYEIKNACRLGYTNKEYVVDMDSLYYYKLLSSSLEIHDIIIYNHNNTEKYNVDSSLWNQIVIQNNNYYDVSSHIKFEDVLGYDPFPNEKKQIEITYSKSMVFEMRVYEHDGILLKDVVLTTDIANSRKMMIYHMYPKYKHALMQLHWYYLKKCMTMFDKVIISIAIDDYNYEHHHDYIRKQLGEPNNVEFINVRNTKHLGEAVSFFKLLNKIEQEDVDYIFYAHSKGLKYHDSKRLRNIACWIELMYIACLSNIDVIINKNVNCAGSFLIRGLFHSSPIPAWHYSGSFYWFNKSVLARKQLINRFYTDYYISEKFPGIICPRYEKCMTLLFDFPKFPKTSTAHNLYDNIDQLFGNEIQLYATFTKKDL